MWISYWFQLCFHNWCDLTIPFFRLGRPKWISFQRNSKWPLVHPPPFLGKNIALFWDKVIICVFLRSLFWSNTCPNMKENLQCNFLDRKWFPHPFQSFFENSSIFAGRGLPQLLIPTPFANHMILDSDYILVTRHSTSNQPTKESVVDSYFLKQGFLKLLASFRSNFAQLAPEPNPSINGLDHPQYTSVLIIALASPHPQQHDQNGQAIISRSMMCCPMWTWVTFWRLCSS